MKNLSTFVRTSGNQFIAGKKFFTTSIAVFGTLADGVNSVGTAGQILVSTATGVVWTDFSAASNETLDSVTDRGNTTTNSITIGGLRVDDTTLYVDATNNRVGIGTLTPQHTFHVEGGAFADYFQLDTTYSNGDVPGRFTWDPDNNTALLGLDNDISLRVGQDDMWFIKNQSGATIEKGSVVYASGTLGTSGRILISKMIADGSIPARNILGITAEDIANGADGYVLAKGKIRQLNTSAFADGQVLWASPTTAGALTATEPSAPNLKLPVAFVVHANANGTLAVRVETGVKISDASDVQVTSVANKNILRYNSSTLRWENVAGTTSSIDEGTNLYYTDARARAALSAGTGISYNSTTGVITNSAPDQTVVVTAGTGISVLSGYPNFTITNTAPDQVVALTGAGTTVVTGTYPNFTITSNDQYVGTVTSVGLSVPTGFTVSGSPVTTSGTFAVGFATGYSLPTDASQANWNTAYNTRIVSASVSGTTTKTLTLTRGDSTTIQATWTDYDTAPVTSVNGQTGVVVLDTDDVAEGTSNLYFTTSRARSSVSAGTGISYNSATGVITNSAPDQTVSITGAGTSVVTGTYPNFTVTTNDQYNGTVTSVGVAAGTGIAVSGSPITSSGTITVTNTAPDQVVGLSAGTGIQVTGTYPNFTITNTSPSSGGTLTGGGTINYVSKWSSATNLVDSQIFDNGTNVGIGTTSPNAYMSGTYGLSVYKNDYPGVGWANSSSYWLWYMYGSTFRMWNSSAGDVLTAQTNGNVGIGTTNPYEALDVVGNIRIGNFTTAGTRYIGYANNTFGNQFIAGMSIESTTLGGNYSQKLNFATHYYGVSAGVRMTIDEAGNVGIGTTSPAYKLDVSGQGRFLTTASEATIIAGGASLYNTYIANSVVVGYIGSGQGMVSGGGATNFGVRAESDLLFAAGGNAERMRITAGGNVGIGTTSPQGPLEIYKSNAGGLGGHIILNNNGTAVGNETAILFNDSGVGSTTYVRAAISSTVEGAPFLGDIKFKTGLGTYGALSTRMIITGAGNVGIGTTAPSQKLDVDGNVIATSFGGRVYPYNSILGSGADASTGTVFAGSTNGYVSSIDVAGGGATNPNTIIIKTASAERMRINADGQLIVGATSTTYNNGTFGYVAGFRGAVTSQAFISISKSNQTLGDQGMIIGLDATTGYVWLRDNINLTFGTNDATRVTILAGGNVGIGTTSPATALDVNGVILSRSGISLSTSSTTLSPGELWFPNGGTIGISGTGGTLNILTSGQSEVLVVNGNVGIGTTIPSEKLEVAGNVILDSSNARVKIKGGVTGTNSGIDWTFNTESTQYAKIELDYDTRATTGLLIDSGYPMTLDYSSGSFSIKKNGTSELTVLNGNVGIGTTSPDTPLFVQGGASGTGGWNRTATLSATFPGLIFNSNGTKWGGMAYDYSAAMRFWVNASNNDIFAGTLAMSIVNSGNVLIGTTTDSGYKLDVNGTGRFNGQLRTTQGGRTLFLGDGSYANHINVDSNVDFAFNYNNGNAGGFGFFAGGTVAKFYISNSGDVTARKIWLSTNGATDATTAILANASTNDSTSYAAIFGSLNAGYRMVVRADGNVGIGTTSPTGELHIYASQPAFRIQSSVSGNMQFGQWDTTTNRIQSTGRNFYLVGTDSYDTIFATNNAERMRITSAGNVGIGTTAPQKRLEVISGGNDFVSVGVAALSVGQWTGIHFGYRESNANYRKSAIVFERTDLTANDAQGKIHILNGPQGSAGSATLADAKLTIAENGNVGIGTTAPSQKLHVVGKIYSIDSGTDGGQIIVQNSGGGNAWYWAARTDGLNLGQLTVSDGRIFVSNAGNVGIGTTSPVERLHVVGSGVFNGSITASGAYLNNANAFVWNQSPSGILRFGTNNTEQVRIDASGNVGIGTTAPIAKLNIRGSEGSASLNAQEDLLCVGGNELGGVGGYAGIKIGGASNSSYGVYIRGVKTTAYGNYWNTALTFSVTRTNTETTTDEIMRITSAGNVGIGTTSPSQKLHVEGSARITGAYYDSSNSSGTSGQVLSSTGSGTQWVAAGSGSDAQNVLTSNAQEKDSTGFDFSGLLAEPVVMTGTNIRAYAPVTIDTNNSILAIVTFEVATYDFTDGKYAFQFYLDSGGELNLSRHIFSQDMWSLPDDSKGYTTFTYHMLISETEGNALTLGDAVNLMVDDNYGMSPLIVFASLTLQKAYNY